MVSSIQDNNIDNNDEDDKSIEACMFGGLDFSNLDVAAITSSSSEEEDSEEEEEETASDYDSTHVDQLLHYQDNLPCASEADFQELFEWVSRQGADLEGIRFDRDNHGGRTLFSTRTCPEGSILATLPRSMRLGQDYACRKLDLPLTTPELSALTLLVLSFCQEGHVYARCLPRQSEFTNALLMSPSEQLQWENQMGSPDYAAAFRALQSRGQACESYIRTYLTTSENNNHTTTTTTTNTLYWAMSMVKSRSHAFGTKRGFWLTPILDLVNHSPTPNARLEGDANGYLVLKALREISSNEEITIDYQVEDDAQLLATYGFSLKASN